MTLPRLERLLDLLTRCLDLTRCRRKRGGERCILGMFHRRRHMFRVRAKREAKPSGSS